MAAYQEGSLVRLQAPPSYVCTAPPNAPIRRLFLFAKHFVSVLKCGANRSTPLERLYNDQGHAQFRQVLDAFCGDCDPSGG